MTTATFRKQAQEFESRLDWSNAAIAWAQAIAAYPSKGPLADLDISKMRARQAAAENAGK